MRKFEETNKNGKSNQKNKIKMEYIKVVEGRCYNQDV